MVVLFLDEIGELGLDEQAMSLRAIEEKRFLPVGADSEPGSDFQLVAGTNCDLGTALANGLFHEDLFARLNLRTFDLPALKDRREDIEPNLDFELARYAACEGENVTFNREARDAYLLFAAAPDAAWIANFRDPAASITRMATLAPQGRITKDVVDDEIARLRRQWDALEKYDQGQETLDEILGPETASQMDRFDAFQLADVIALCRQHKSASAAGRALFANSRQTKKSAIDADRLVKYLARFGLKFEELCGCSG